MANLINLTVEVRDGETLDTPVTWGIDPNYLKIALPENTDTAVDRAYVEYYDNQMKRLRQIVTTQTVDQVLTLANASVTNLMFYAVIDTVDDYKIAKLGILNSNDGFVTGYPLAAGVFEPKRATYDFGERNHADHKVLEYCSFPLTVTAVDESDDSITVGCCVDNFILYGETIYVNGDAFYVLNSSCTDDGGVLLLDGDVSVIEVGNDVQLTPP